MTDDSTSEVTPPFERRKRRLLAEVRSGSREALAELLEAYRPFLRLWARRAPNDPLRRKLDTSDLVQNTLRAVLMRADEFRELDDDEFSNRLRELLQAEVSASHKHYYRPKKRNIRRELSLGEQHSWQRLAQLVVSPNDDALKTLDDEEMRRRVEGVLECLDPDEQVAIRQRYWDHLEWPQVAALSGCTSDAARMRFKRAMARFAKEFRRKFPDA
ncbi:MAG: sigma-70 family RNA polymerase sigma factor [Pirellulales bacterium]|nr:sigma-70 family RNA polymerase sigma factor [Pirellulales bacterium]